MNAGKVWQLTERAYCWATLCAVLERLPWDWAGIVWFHAHHNRVWWAILRRQDAKS